MLGGPAPVLLRNYDYPPMLCDALALRTHWSGRSVIGMSDCGWGLMDGVNDAGLAVSISFGGRRDVGPGFGIGLIVRCLLQVAATTDEAVDRLMRIPVQMSYNVAIVDAIGDRRVVHIAPDRTARISYDVTVANRQGKTEWPEHAEYCNTVEREYLLETLVAGPMVDAGGLEAAFLQPPLHRSLLDSTWGTVYTAAYEPASGAMTLLWPDDRWQLSVHGSADGFRPRRVQALVPDPVPVRTEIPRQEGTLFLL